MQTLVGDIPPIYSDIYGPQSTKEVLEDYVRSANDWIKQVHNGYSIENCYPLTRRQQLK